MGPIHMEVVAHDRQSYPTCGNYWTDDEGTQIRISEMQNEDYEFLVFLHELVELYLCKKRGISDEAITEFDIQFEKDRKEGNEDEPGDAPDAPYRKEHGFAGYIEELMAAELGVDWHEYDQAVRSL